MGLFGRLSEKELCEKVSGFQSGDKVVLTSAFSDGNAKFEQGEAFTVRSVRLDSKKLKLKKEDIGVYQPKDSDFLIMICMPESYYLNNSGWWVRRSKIEKVEETARQRRKRLKGQRNAASARRTANGMHKLFSLIATVVSLVVLYFLFTKLWPVMFA